MARRLSSRGPRLAKRFVLIQRRGGSVAGGGDGGGEGGADPPPFIGYVGTVPDGRPDIRVIIDRGGVRDPRPRPNRGLDLNDYPDGVITIPDGGFGWQEPGIIVLAFKAIICREFFDDYTVNAAPVLNGGWGWDGAGLTCGAFQGFAAEESFTGYADGPVSKGDLSGGRGWTEAPLIVSY